MNTQRDNREETIINQDATVFIEAIRNGSRGLDDLTNYVYAITNTWTAYNSSFVVISNGVSGYIYDHSTAFPLTNGLSIIGLLSTPEYTCPSGQPIPTLIYGGTSNHIVAYVRSLSGPAVEKPPQTNSTIQADAFGYRILCVNSPVAASSAIIPNAWNSVQTYGPASPPVYFDCSFWQANTLTSPGEAPGISPKWSPAVTYNLAAAAILHELRLTFLWPQLPNGNVGPGRQTFRTMVSGQIAQINASGQWLYFYKPQTFANAP
jgi:hypothetical protein